MKRIYLDNNATTQLDPRVTAVMVEELEYGPANPSSIHYFGREAKGRLNQARRTIGDYLGVRPGELFFSSCGTESLNMFLRGQKGHIITSDIEHSSIYKPATLYEKGGGAATFLRAGLTGAVAPQDLLAAIRPDTRLITLSAVNSETGVKNQLQEIAAIAKRAKIPFVVDGVALLGKEKVELFDGISAMVFSAHKLHGPKGVGVAWIAPQMKFEPLLVGGDQEFSKRAGTENCAAIRGFAKAVELLDLELDQASKRMRQLRDHLEMRLKELCENLVINGTGERVVNTTNLSFPGLDGEALLMQLDLQGIALSHGSACSSGALEPSRVLLNMGIPKEIASTALRFSLSRYTTLEEIEEAAAIIASTTTRLLQLSR